MTDLSEFYVVKALYEKNASKNLHIFDNLSDLAEHVLECWNCDAHSVRVFRCVEVDFNAYRTAAQIDIGKDKK